MMREHGFCAVTLFAIIKLLSHFLTQSVQETDSKGAFSMAFPKPNQWNMLARILIPKG